MSVDLLGVVHVLDTRLRICRDSLYLPSGCESQPLSA
jgi:hypothetical protein